MNSELAIEFKDVYLSYDVKVLDPAKSKFGKRPAMKTIKNDVLKGINLSIHKGEVIGIIGTNGSGKSTILSLMAKILEPDSGSVSVVGKVASILELGMGFHNDLTGRENIILKGELYGFSKKEMKSRMESIIEYSGIRHYIDNPVRTYSSGMRSRLAFSIMINVDAEVMLVDEILSTGDATFSIKAADYFKKILKDGKTVVYVSHTSGQIESMCTRAIWIKDGRIVSDGNPKKVCAEYYDAITSSFDIIYDQAQSGLPEAQYRLAMIYKDDPELCPDSNVRYMEWIRKSADQGYALAQVELADYLISLELDSSVAEAKSYYSLAANRGNPDARLKLSTLMSPDENKSLHLMEDLYKYVLKNENPADLFRYANFMFKVAWNKDAKKIALDIYKVLVEKYNHPEAVFQLATMYRDGVGVKKNKAKYIEYLKKGADYKVLKSMTSLADAYISGAYVPRDESKAFQLYLESAEMGSSNSQYKVATMYYNGEGIVQDLEKSKFWYNVYSETILAPYKIALVDLLKKKEVEDYGEKIKVLLHNSLDTYSPDMMILLCKSHKEKLISLTQEKLNEYILRLSKIYGKYMKFAYENYNLASFDNDDIFNEMIMKRRYGGDGTILFKSYCLSAECDKKGFVRNPIDDLILSARKNYPPAIIECEKLGVNYK